MRTARQLPQTYATSRDIVALEERLDKLEKTIGEINGQGRDACTCVSEDVCDGGREDGSQEAVGDVQGEQADVCRPEPAGDGVQRGTEKHNTGNKKPAKQGNETKTKGRSK